MFVIFVVVCSFSAQPVPEPSADRYVLGAAVVHGGLTVWPVVDRRPGGTGGYPLLADGLARGAVKVEEKDGGTVPELLVRNGSDLPLLLAAGDLVTGGRQDRVVVADLVVPAHSDATVAVNCVEQGRWNGGTQFGSGGRAEYALKQAVEIGTDQHETWTTVAALNAQKAEALKARGLQVDALAPSTGPTARR